MIGQICRFSVVGVASLILLTWASTASAQAKLPLYYFFSGQTAPFTKNNTDLLLDAAIMGARWPTSEPSHGVFDLTLISQQVSDWTAGGKSVLLMTAPYSQTATVGSATGDNIDTPSWVYDAGVPRITFTAGGVSAGTPVSVPKVWDSRFLPLYGEYLGALAAQFGADSRIAGIVVGIGHNGFMTAQPSTGGETAFLAAGWSLSVWQTYFDGVIDLAVAAFPSKPIYVLFTPVFLRDFQVINNLTTAQAMVAYAAQRGVRVIFSGLDPDTTQFATTGVTELVAYLGTLGLPPNYAVGFTDDVALWLPTSQQVCPGPTCGRNTVGLQTELQEGVNAWASGSNGRFSMFYVFNDPETSASNLGSSTYDPSVYDVVVQFLYVSPSLVAAVLPSSRSVPIGVPATAFATIINRATSTASSVGISLVTSVPAGFTFQTTDPSTNRVTGTPNTRVDIAAGQLQTYVIAITPTAAFAPADVAFNFSSLGSNIPPASMVTGVNTWLLSASASPVADVVALAATMTNDGIVHVSSATGAGAFAVSTVDVGAAATITATADTGANALPVSLTICQLDAVGGCMTPPAASATTTMAANATASFGVFVSATNVPFNPETNRIFVRFTDDGGVVRGSTSVAVQTQ